MGTGSGVLREAEMWTPVPVSTFRVMLAQQVLFPLLW